MAIIYVRSTTGSNSNNGSTWALAKATLAGAAAIAVAGDTVYVSHAHAELSTGAAISPVFAGTPANPIKVVCVNDAAEPPTAVATTATVTTTGANAVSIQGSVYVYGIALSAGDGANFASLGLNGATGNHRSVYEACKMTVGNTHPSSQLVIGAANGGDSSRTSLLGCTLKTTSTSTPVLFNGFVDAIGGGFDATTATWSGGAAFALGGTSRDGHLLCEDFDFSPLASGTPLLQAPATKAGRAVFRNVKLPASFSGLFSAAVTLAAYRARLDNGSNGSTTPQKRIEDMHGKLVNENTVIRTGGADQSWKVTTNSSCTEVMPFEGDEIYVPIAAGEVGASKTVLVHTLIDSVTALTNAEMWAEAHVLATSGQLIGTPVSCKRASLVTTAAAHAASLATWTTTGLSNPNKQQLAVTFTPQVAGIAILKLFVGKPSTTVYFCPQAV